MSGRGSCWDNAVVERFFGSFKNEWLLNIYHLTRHDLKEDVEAYSIASSTMPTNPLIDLRKSTTSRCKKTSGTSPKIFIKPTLVILGLSN